MGMPARKVNIRACGVRNGRGIKKDEVEFVATGDWFRGLWLKVSVKVATLENPVWISRRAAI
jgi:hypothetical protein